MGGGPARAFPQRDPGARSVLSVEFASDARGQILGVRGEMVHDHGAYTPQGTNVPYNSASSLSGPYLVPAYRLQVSVVHTNKVPVATAARLSAGGIRDGTHAGPDRAGRGHRPRGMPPAQPDSRGPDPLRQAAEVQGRGAAHDRQRRFSSPAARALAEIGYAEFDARRREAPRAAAVASAWPMASSRRGGAVRVRAGPYRAVRTDTGCWAP